MNFSRFCSLSDEDFSVKGLNYVFGGNKEYRDCGNFSQVYWPMIFENQTRKIVGFGKDFSLICVHNCSNSVSFFPLIFFPIFFIKFLFY
jgi:hypothetical protein